VQESGHGRRLRRLPPTSLITGCLVDAGEPIAALEVIKTGPKQRQRPFRARLDCKTPKMHDDRTGPVLRLAIDFGPIEDVWESFYVAFSAKTADHGAS
jgi:hypothetical protein